MKAIVKTSAGEGRLELADWPHPAADEVKLQIAYAGICGTDIHIIKGEWPCKPPVVLGHEFCGTVVETGESVGNYKPGDRVVASNPAQTCGRCHACRAGNPFMCPERVSAGYMIDGAFAEYLCIREERCHHLPDNVSYRQAALGEPLAVAVHAVMERTTVHAGDLVFVSGPGCVGIFAMLIAKLEGARVVVSGTAKDQQRLECARKMGPMQWSTYQKRFPGGSTPIQQWCRRRFGLRMRWSASISGRLLGGREKRRRTGSSWHLSWANQD
jgi:L-iditol 2-dehydrogenase